MHSVATPARAQRPMLAEPSIVAQQSIAADSSLSSHVDSAKNPQHQQRKKYPGAQAHQVQHRIGAVMAHVPWYAFKSQARLAADLGFSKSAVSRLLSGECTPSLALACALTQTLEKRLGRKLDMRELFSPDGTYPTASACQLVGCSNCLPPDAYDKDDNLRSEYKNVQAGQWSVAPQQPTSHRHDHLADSSQTASSKVKEPVKEVA